MNSQMIELVIEKIVYDGTGLAKLPSGKSVFVPFTLPEEKIVAKIIEDKRDFARAQLIEILIPSLKRRQPLCPHFGVCGGCHFQHIPYLSQLDLKKEILVEQWERIGKTVAIPVIEVLASDLEWNYRASLQFRLDDQGGLGFSRMNEVGVIPIRECYLPSEPVAQTWPLLKFEQKSEVKRVEIRSGTDGEVMVTLTGNAGQVPEVETDLSVSIAYISPAGVSILAGDDHINVSLLDKNYRVSPGAFFQVNPYCTEKMMKWIQQHAGTGKILLDAYCGGGLFSALLESCFERVIGIEAAPQACEDYTYNLDELNHIELYQGQVEHVLPYLNIKPDLVLLDPPRSGAAKSVVDWILNIRPNRIIYVSCNPATLGRDGGQFLKNGYALQACALCDMFPQTYHIESINVFTKK